MAELKRYNTPQSGINLDKITGEIISSNCVSGFMNVTFYEGINEVAVFGVSFSDEALCDSIISSHEKYTLEEYKELKYKDIDEKTSLLIFSGFTYGGKVFSLSTNAQTNLLALDHSKDDPALSYPISYNTKNDKDSYDVVDSTDLHNMYLTALATKKGHQDSGTVLKKSVRDCTTKEEIDLVVDNR